MLRVINLSLVIAILVNSFYLTSQRFAARQSYMELSKLQNQTDVINKEYTRLQLEEGTYSSGLAVQDYALNKLGLIQADKQHIVELN